MSGTRVLLVWQTYRVRLCLVFAPRDLWIGASWDIRDGLFREHLHLAICLVPMLPLRVQVPLRSRPPQP